MILHNTKLFLLLCGLTFGGTVKAREVVSDCDLIKQATLEGAINPRLVLAVANVESSKNGKAISRYGETHYGLMQLKLGTARMMGFRGKPTELLNWKLNLRYGSKYLDSHLRRYQSKKAAAAAYNAGTAFTCRKGHGCTKGSFVNQDYVDRVMRKYRGNSPQC
jgi:soluble lytic murein transglycosylase-like protein